MLLPIVLTVWILWWFLEFFDSFFSPLYDFLFGEPGNLRAAQPRVRPRL